MSSQRLYSKIGDGGETCLLGGERVRKDDARVEAVGDVDELSAQVGLLIVDINNPLLMDELRNVQESLFRIGARLASAGPVKGIEPLGETDTSALEAAMARIQKTLPAQSGFILPGGSRASALAHVARTVSRRAERRVVTLQSQTDEPDLDRIQIYLNRLSDFLYGVARWCNHAAGVADVPSRSYESD